MSNLKGLAGARRIGVFGGTFDPVHYGHLACAEQLREAAGLDAVLFLPCNRQPHKPRYKPSPASHRLAMLRAATRKYEEFLVSDLETRRGGVSFTVDTVTHLREILGHGPQIWLLLGMDAFLDVPRWKRPETIVRECRFAVAARPGYPESLEHSKSREYAKSRISRAITRRSRFFEITALDISSTDIRKRVARGKTVRFLIPDIVASYIERTGLYL